jgi:hypothetical protein
MWVYGYSDTNKIYQYTNAYEYTNPAKDYQYTNDDGRCCLFVVAPPPLFKG